MKKTVTTLARQPLFHFLVLGGLLFALYGWINRESEDDQNRILVDDAALLKHIQYRNRAFNGDAAATYLERLDADARQRLVGELVREEVLYREARSLGLDRDDYVIKRRMIQKMEYLARGFGLAEEALDDGEVAAYYAEHRERYARKPAITFTHVFVSDDRDDPRQQAEILQATLNGDGVSFARGLSYGDRFIYHANYVERDRDYIASHFGDAFADAVMALPADEGLWAGPVASDYGWHLVMVSDRQAGGVPPLDSIRGQVYQDAYEDKLAQQTEAFIDDIIDQYEVVVQDKGTDATAAGNIGG